MTNPAPPPPPGHTPPPAPPQGPLGPPPQSSRRGLPILIGVLVLVLIVSGAIGVVALRGSTDGGSGSSGAKPLPKSAMPKTDPKLAAFYGQKLDWSACGANQCADLTVPLDYAKPGGTTIKVAVVKVPAKKKSLGPLVVNPGGPGGSGIDFAKAGSYAFTQPMMDNYDIVGFDPRGVGASTRLTCLDTAGLDAYFAQDQDPDTQAERDTYAQSIVDFGKACEKNSGDLVRHVSTADNVADMDILRQALGQAKLTFLGASYGTELGAQYATTFPSHVGRMVLDGAVDQALSYQDLALGQAGGFETALRAYLKDCVSQGGCPLGDSVDAAAARVARLVQQIEADPLPTSLNVELTGGNAFIGITAAMYTKQYWPVLTQAFKQAIGGNGSLLLQLDYAYGERNQGRYSALIPVFLATSCLDDSEGVAIDDVPSYFTAFEKVSPTFGRAFAFGLANCRYWPIKSDRRLRPVSGKGLPKILVVGTTRDPATPYRWAQGLTKELAPAAVLLTRDGDGHTAIGSGNACIDDAVDGYLVSGKVPEVGTKC